MERSLLPQVIKWTLIGAVITIGLFQRWRIERKAQKTQETVDVFELVALYRKTYSRAHVSEEEGFSQQAYDAAMRKSEDAYRIQMGAYLQQYFSYKQMSAAINQRKVNAIYDGGDILSGMMQVARNKAIENIKHVKKTLSPNGPNIDVRTRRRRRR